MPAILPQKCLGRMALERMLTGLSTRRCRSRSSGARGPPVETSLRSRSVIDQAMGVLIGQAGITPEEAFEPLRLRSQSLNIKLRDVAADVIAEARRQR